MLAALLVSNFKTYLIVQRFFAKLLGLTRFLEPREDDFSGSVSRGWKEVYLDQVQSYCLESVCGFESWYLVIGQSQPLSAF